MPREKEWVTFEGFVLLKVGPPSRVRTIMAMRELIFMSERDARDAQKKCGGTWVTRRAHKTRKAELRAFKKKKRGRS